jgi:chloramphenicol 3-O phosphotransferase
MKKILILLTILYSSYTLTEIQNVLHENYKNNQQKIIIINGSSSAGKTSIIKHMQQISTTPLLTIGIDLLWEMIPPQYTNTGLKAQEGFLFVETKDDSGRPLITIKLG